MTENEHTSLPKDIKKVLGMEGIILGYLLGGILVYWAGSAWLNHEHLIHSAVEETLWVAVYLTMVVGYCGLKMPVFFHKSPFLSTFALVMFAGHISLLFDSFAVVLLLATGITFLPLTGTNHRYNQFVAKVAAAFAALTVGGGFYLGELWGLPWFITNGLDNPLAGFPILLVLTPYCALIALWVALTHPVKMEKVTFDKGQILAAVEFVVALALIIVTHSPFLSIGVLLVYTALRSSTLKLVDRVMHEVKDGAANALGLILLAVIAQAAGLAGLIQPWLQGAGMFFGAAVSSPFAGAMAPAAANLHDFYAGLSLLMLGAPLFVFSSLVAIVVFKETIDYEDLPKYMKGPAAMLGGRKRGHIQEGVAYTLLVIPMLIGLAGFLYLANDADLFVTGAGWLGVEMPAAVESVKIETH